MTDPTRDAEQAVREQVGNVARNYVPDGEPISCDDGIAVLTFHDRVALIEAGMALRGTAEQGDVAHSRAQVIGLSSCPTNPNGTPCELCEDAADALITAVRQAERARIRGIVEGMGYYGSALKAEILAALSSEGT